MEANGTTNSNTLRGKMDVLMAIAAATAANCIPCFEHLYEKAVTAGITADEIRRASEIAGFVKRGAHNAITACIDEIIGSREDGCPEIGQASSGCRCR